MSAYLDKSQGVTFVFSNIYELYQKAKNTKLDAPLALDRESLKPKLKSSERVIKEQAGLKIEEFKPKNIEDNGRTFPVPMGVREAEEKALKANKHSVAQMKKNLGDLESAHEKLRFLLQELETLTKKN